jgi:hypothetical protein
MPHAPDALDEAYEELIGDLAFGQEMCGVMLCCSWPRHVAHEQRRTSLMSQTIAAFTRCWHACLYALVAELPCVAQELRVRTPAWFKQL